MKLTRYTRSFIGTMEMDKDGKWCLFSEADDTIKQKQDLVDFYCRESSNNYNDCTHFMQKYYKQLYKAFMLGVLLLISLFINIFQAII